MATATDHRTQPARSTGPTPHRETSGWRKTWSDILVLAQRNLRHMVRDPFEVIMAITMPLLMVLLFGYVFGDVMSGTGADNYRAFLVPAMLAMVMLYGVAGTATGIARDTERDVMSRFRSMPMSPMAILGARTLTDMMRATVEIVLLIGCGVLMGWRFEDGPGGVLAAVGLLLLFRFALVWVGVLIGLYSPAPDAASMIVYPLAFPLSMLSTSFIPAAAMPSWLAPIAEWNPLSAVVTATRDLFGNPSLPSDAWPAENALVLAVAIPLLLIAVCVPLSLRRFRSLSR
ncbi:ABC transporter permease [Nocardiopsis valliformis]|uniref:ABC transporter permease n=1 Tax=Nocardiopsis valliformis TaxID=239974 RepID=UPI00034D7F57|nr:ABC transporter permease [Nocardiopsis valliformis]